MKDQSLIDPESCDYALKDIVNFVLKDKEDGQITMVSELTDKQARKALLVYVKEFNRLKDKIEKLKSLLEKV